MPDVDRLLAGHSTVGTWTLGQICNHLATVIRYSVVGYPDRMPWLFRQTIGRVARSRTLKAGRIPEGIKVPQRYLPSPGLDDRVETEELRATIALFDSAEGPPPSHPILGPLTRAEWARFHCVHCAHHLSFAWPAESPKDGL